MTSADLEATRLALADLREQHEALAHVVRQIGRSPFDLEEALQAILEAAVRLCSSERGFIYLLDGDVYRHAVDVGAPPEVVAFNKAHPIRPSRATLTGRTALERRPVHIQDTLDDLEYDYPEAQRLGGFRTQLGVPMLREGVAIGVIDIWRDEVRPFEQREIDLVALFADQATIAFETTRLLRTVDRQRTELARFLSPQVAALISSDEGEALLSGHRREITVLFCDLRGFTAFSESAPPEDVLLVLREYHAAMGELIGRHGGTLERFAGDGIMVFFNDPIVVADHSERAVRMAIAMRDRSASLAAGWRKLGYELGFGIGIAAGFATLGRIGYEGRSDYGAIGSVVNLAARLCAEAADGSILLSQRTLAMVEGVVEVHPVGPLSLKGFSRPVAAFDVVGPVGGAD